IAVNAPITSTSGGLGLTFNSTGRVTLNADMATHGGRIVVNDNVTVAANVRLDTTGGAAGADIALNGVVRDATPGAHGLTLAAGTGTVTIAGRVGGGSPLASLTIDAGRMFLRDVTTSGAGGQIYNGQVLLTADAAFLSTDAPITFNGTLDSDTGFGGTARNLFVSAGVSSITF